MITPEDDNYGFARWVEGNKEELIKLGPGRHFGEWFGFGIQRGYGLKEKKFALFNTKRWGTHNPNTPECCTVVPILEPEGQTGNPYFAMLELKRTGSIMVPGYMFPEGIVVFIKDHVMYKDTFDNSEGKWNSL